MRTIEIEDSTYELLESKAHGFEDTPNKVINRLLALNSENESEETLIIEHDKPVWPPGQEPFLTNKLATDLVILAIGTSKSKSNTRARVTRVFEKIFGKLLHDSDKELLPSKREIRWKNTLAWGRKHAIDLGLIQARNYSGYNNWQLTRSGENAYHKIYAKYKNKLNLRQEFGNSEA